MDYFKVKITGSGTIDQIIESLEKLKNNLIATTDCCCDYEDATLFMEMSQDD